MEVKDQIDSLSAQTILNNPKKYVDRIHRAPTGTLNDEGGYIDTSLMNLSKAESAGLDIGASYVQNLGFARFNTAFKISKLVHSKTQESPEEPLCDSAKYNANPDGNINMDLLGKIWNGSANVRYIGGGDTHSGGYNPGTCNFADPDTNFHVSSYAELGLNVGYVAPWGTQFGIGMNNVTNAAPAYNRNAGWPFYSQTTFTNQGRFIYGTIAHKFD